MELKHEKRGRRCRAGVAGLRMAGKKGDGKSLEKGQNLEQTQHIGKTSSRKHEIHGSASWSSFGGI